MRRLLSALLLFIPVMLSARVISYAPYSDRPSIPAIQSRLDTHIVVFEANSAGNNRGQLVVYDTQAFEEPRVVLNDAIVNSVAAREDDQQFAILVQGGTPSDGRLSVCAAPAPPVLPPVRRS